MLRFLFSRQEKSLVPQTLYRLIVEQARQPVFFTDYGFKDEVMGRFDCLALHVFLVSHRLANGNHKLFPSLNQEVYDCFVEELEVSLREIGIGDTTVPKRKKKLVRSFYGMIEDFQVPVLEKREDELREKIAQRFSNEGQSIDVDRLAQYVLNARGTLENLSDEAILSGKLEWPEA